MWFVIRASSGRLFSGMCSGKNVLKLGMGDFVRAKIKKVGTVPTRRAVARTHKKVWNGSYKK